MSVRLDTSTDNIRRTLTSALSLSTGVHSWGCWLKLKSDVDTRCDIFVASEAAGDDSPSFGFRLDSTGTALELYHGNDGGHYALALSTDTWYWIVGKRVASTNLHLLVFDDSTSTTPVTSATADSDSVDFSTVDTILIGDGGFGLRSADMEICNIKIHNGVEWSDAESRTESQYFGIQKSGGTDRYCWGLEDLDADQYGLNEYGGSGENLTNSGAVAGASRPSQLQSAGGTLEQEGFRWYEDNGSESGSSAAANQDTNITAAAGATKRLRMLVNATGDPATKQFKLQWKKSGGSWADVL